MNLTFEVRPKPSGTLSMVYSGLHTVISGGQTGADQGGLIAAVDARLMTGGCAPAGWRTDIGPNPILEALGLHASGDYGTRTIVNIRMADATVILAHNVESPGTRLTIHGCTKHSRPYLIVGINDLVFNKLEGQATLDRLAKTGTDIADFIIRHEVQILNVAGNREIKDGEQRMTEITKYVMRTAFDELRSKGKLVQLRSVNS